MTSYTLTDRNAEIARLYSVEKWTLAEIASEFSISRERVRQILSAQGVQDRHYGARKRAEREVTLRDAHQRIVNRETTTAQEASALGLETDSLRVAFRRIGLPPLIRVEAPHGTRQRYIHYGCRCDLCKQANAEYQRSLRGREPTTHGTVSGYSNYGCRCDECREAMRLKRRERKIARMEREEI